MNAIKLVVAAVFVGAICRATQIVAISDLDYTLFRPNKTLSETVANYMQENGLDDQQMISVLDANIREHLTKKNEFGRVNCVVNSLSAMLCIGSTNATEALKKYVDPTLPEKARAQALRLYLMGTGLDGLSFATNVLLTAQFGWRESNVIRTEYVTKASVTPPEEGEAYIEFFKWAIMHMAGASALELDKNLLELDGTWRTNEIRRVSADRVLAMNPPPFATGPCNNIIRDYELATGIRQLDPPPGPSNPVVVDPDVPPSTNADTASASSAVPSEDRRSAPTMHSRKVAAAVGALFFVLIAAVVWHRRHSGKRP